ncbi:hypothetical protein CPB84DRAFT_1781377 [Gymnopilus junonius]|uniref:SEC7 domain-containing protein n=1 Tax=Gymnopilus junonius TaxID=109634 RepID=A0A9P5NLQ3_GYMJU|nr:hypothetical protein CPB84DRAFT_1781377 [Gymnopilus junonius]
MADQETHSSRAEQRMLAVAKLKRAASLPRMKDGRRPPMHVEAVSEGEKAQSEGEKVEREETEKAAPERNGNYGQETAQVDEEEKSPEPDSDNLAPATAKSTDGDLEADTELEERPLSPTTAFKKRRSRSRSRSRGSKDFKGKFKPPQSPVPQLGGDSSPDENPIAPSPVVLPMVPPLLSPIPHFPFLQQSRFLRSPTPVAPEMSLFYPGTSPPTPLPTLEDLSKSLMRSNSAGSSAAAGRRAAMHKLTGGTETYDPSPSPTPPPYLSKLSRNNTVSGGERIAARQNMLNRLGTRIKEADADIASGGEDRGAPSPTPAKRRRRRSRRSSATAAAGPNPPTVSDSSNPNTPAIPSTPLPTLPNHFAELRAQSTTPNQLSSSRTQSSERVEEEPERPELTRRRSVLIEDPDEEDRDLPEQSYVGSPGTPHRTFDSQRNLPSSESPSNIPDLSMTLPIHMNQRAPSRNGLFSGSPFQAPIKEKTLSDEDEEQVIYPATTARPRTPYGNAIENYEREISWVASPVPEIRMPIDDDDDEDDNLEQEVDVQVEPEDEEIALSGGSSHEAPDNISRASSSSKSVLVESEISPEPEVPYVQASSSIVESALQSTSHDEPASPQTSQTRLSAASRNQSIGDRSPLATDFSEWEGYLSTDSPRRVEPTSSTNWRQKVKETFSRAGSSTGRRSRTNSIATRERRDNTDSSVSRESGASLISAKTDKGDGPGTPGQLHAPLLMQSPSASASILSLSPHAPPRSSVSPIPPPSSADMSKYNRDAKLFPFPGMLRLEQEKNERLLKDQPSPPASSSDSHMQSNAQEGPHAPALVQSFSNASSRTPDVIRDQTSDTRLFARYDSETTSAVASSSSHQEYIDVSPAQQNGSGYNLKLPTTLPGVKQWLSKNSKKKAASPPGTAPGTIALSSLPPLDSQATPITSKPSISDIFAKKPNDINEWEEMTSQPSSNGGTLLGQNSPSSPTNGIAFNGLSPQDSNVSDKGFTSKVNHLASLDLTAGRGSPFRFPNEPPSLTRFTTPDPSSVSDYPAATASESSSTTSSQYSMGMHQGHVLFERLEEFLARGPKNPVLTSAIEEPPRKLILSWPVLQVVNPNTVKDRFLFLFNDILVIAKPVTYDQDNLMDTHKMSLPDRKYTVKSVVQLRYLRFCADRSEAQGKAPPLGVRSPLIRSFISQFSKDPDLAIKTLFTKSDVQDDPVLLGQLLSRILELDRSRLGEYLSRKTSKAVLKSYLDSFGFTGLRVDVALRVFLHSVNVSRHSHSYGALEHLLDSLGSRWYEANAKFVAYDKDMAVRLVWALTQLNERLHGGIAEEPGPTDHIRRTVTSKEFLDAFRRYDTRYLVSDELLQELYRSIFHERLCQASPSTYGHLQDTPITIKRPLPSRLTYKAQSEPVVLRLPQADPLLTIELYGQDLEFDPPMLQFSKSPEASFRIMGKSLGSKTITMCRSGPNATKYSALPLSHTVVVERAFMRNTFQLAFQQSGLKRRYMFSVDDPIIRNEWATSLKRHIDAATVSAMGPSGSSSGTVKFQKAADAIAFKVLQETLMGSSPAPAQRTTRSPVQKSSNGTYLIGSFIPNTSPLHIRSKSRSRVYHRGAGKNELDLQRSGNDSYDSNDYSPDSSERATEQRADGVVWTSRDLEIHCQQNSSISSVLSYLQVGAQEGT